MTDSSVSGALAGSSSLIMYNMLRNGSWFLRLNPQLILLSLVIYGVVYDPRVVGGLFGGFALSFFAF